MKVIALLKKTILGLCLVWGLNSIAQNCNASFSITAGNTAGLFSFASTGNNSNTASYYWSLDNGVYIGSGHTNSLSYQFPANGIYQVCLQVVDSLNNMCSDYECDSLIVSGLSSNNGGGCQASFIVYPDSSNAYTFVSTSNASPAATNSWSVDGGYAGSGSVLHPMLSNGFHLVCLTVIDSVNNCSDTYCDTVDVNNNNNGGGCQASFIVYPDSSNGYTFVSNSNAALSAIYSWSVDGTYSGSGAVLHTSFTNGPHLVCLTVSDSANNCSDTFCDSIYGGNNGGGCQAGYIAYPDSSNGYTFLSTSSVSPSATYSWSVDGTYAGNGVVLSTVLSSGLHAVCLTVNDSANNCSDTYCDTVNANNNNNGGTCHAYFIMWQDSMLTGSWYALNLSGTSTPGTALSYLWNFGDGTTSNLPFPSHQYVVPGHYNICLTISDNNGCTDTYCDTSIAHKMSSSASGMSSITVVTSATSIKKKDFASTEISAYPNPVADQVNLNISIAENAAISIQLVDLFGKVISVQKTSLSAGSNSLKLNTSELPQGVYMIQITNLANNQSKTLRIVK